MDVDVDVNVDTAAADKPTTIAQLEEARTYGMLFAPCRYGDGADCGSR
jgi:hypothetical protein